MSRGQDGQGGTGVNTRFLETFVTVANLGSFHAAADRLNVSQATVSSRISALETELVNRTTDHPVIVATASIGGSQE